MVKTKMKKGNSALVVRKINPSNIDAGLIKQEVERELAKMKGEDILVLGMQKLAQESANLTIAQMPHVITNIKSFEGALEATKKFLSQQVIADVEAKGTKVPETKSIEYNGIRIKPHRTTLDDKKVEALIRGKGKDVAQYMETVITYKVSNEMELITRGALTADELETCRHKLTWVLDLKNGAKDE